MNIEQVLKDKTKSFYGIEEITKGTKVSYAFCLEFGEYIKKIRMYGGLEPRQSWDENNTELVDENGKLVGYRTPDGQLAYIKK